MFRKAGTEYPKSGKFWEKIPRRLVTLPQIKLRNSVWPVDLQNLPRNFGVTIGLAATEKTLFTFVLKMRTLVLFVGEIIQLNYFSFKVKSIKK